MTPDPIQIATGPGRDIILYRGEDKVIKVAGPELDGATAIEWWLGRSAYARDNEDDVFVKKSLGDGIAAVDGGVEITLAADDTASIRSEVYYHELKITKDGGIKVIVTGAAVIRMSINMESAPEPLHSERWVSNRADDVA